jgi:hypothetical protein
MMNVRAPMNSLNHGDQDEQVHIALNGSNSAGSHLTFAASVAEEQPQQDNDGDWHA